MKKISKEAGSLVFDGPVLNIDELMTHEVTEEENENFCTDKK